MAQLNSSFVFHLYIFKLLLKICADARTPREERDSREGPTCHQNSLLWLERPQIPLADEVWEDIYKQAADIVQTADLPQHHVRRLRAVHGCPAGLRSSEDYRREVFVPMCNKTLAELQRRFLSEENLAVYGGICVLTPKVSRFSTLSRFGRCVTFMAWQRNATSCRLRST